MDEVPFCGTGPIPFPHHGNSLTNNGIIAVLNPVSFKQGGFAGGVNQGTLGGAALR